MNVFGNDCCGTFTLLPPDIGVLTATLYTQAFPPPPGDPKQLNNKMKEQTDGQLTN